VGPAKAKRRPGGGGGAVGIDGDILARLEKFADLDPGAVARLRSRTWPPLPLSEVA
jgi:hypothetical protein